MEGGKSSLRESLSCKDLGFEQMITLFSQISLLASKHDHECKVSLKAFEQFDDVPSAVIALFGDELITYEYEPLCEIDLLAKKLSMLIASDKARSDISAEELEQRESMHSELILAFGDLDLKSAYRIRPKLKQSYECFSSDFILFLSDATLLIHIGISD